MAQSISKLTHGGFNTGRRVCVVGGGIGGLTAALAFARSGARVTVLEQAGAFKEVGAGIQITPNGARALEDLGLRDEMSVRGVAAQAVEPVDGLTGYPITRFDLSQQQPAYRFFHRAELLGLLAEAALAAGVTVQFGTRVTAARLVSAGGDGAGRGPSDAPPVAACVFSETADAGAAEHRADLVIGADGIHSALRGFVAGSGAEAQPAPAQFTGQVAWRAIVSAKNIEPVARIWMGPQRHIVTYPLAQDMLNIVAVQERQDWAQDGWHHVDAPEHLRSAFADFCPAVQGLLAHVEAPGFGGCLDTPLRSAGRMGLSPF